MKDRRSRAWVAGLALSLCAGLLPAVALEGPLLRDPWTVHDDARQVVYQARLAARGGLLASDPNARHARLYLPAALAWSYRALGRWVDPLTLTKLLPLLLSPLLAGLVFAAVARRDGAGAGVVAATLVALHSWSRWPPQWGAGDAGEWLAPLVAAFLWAVETERATFAAIVTVFAAHLYPPAFMLLAVASGLLFAHEFAARGARQPSRACTTLMIGAIAGAALVGARTLAYDEGDFGRLFTLAEARPMVEFSSRGRSPLFFDGPWTSLINDRSGLALDAPTWALAILVLIGVLAAGRDRKAPPRAVIAITTAGLALWLAARYVVFLYQPVRFVVVTLPLAAAWVAAINLARGIDRFRASRGPTVTAVAGALSVGLSLFLAVPRLYASHVTASPTALYEAVRKLPGDALLAGPPLTMDFVPPFGERRVLVSDEMMPPMFVKRYQVVRGLMADMLTAYTAGDAAEVDAFCAHHGVTHWIVDLDDFDPRATWSYFPPFDEIVSRARLRGAPYALADAARDHSLARAGSYALLQCPLGTASAQPAS